jgi:oxaloacetate decarboxylase alpha subunit
MAKDITLAENLAEDVLIHAMFPQVGLKFLENRGNADAFEPAPTGEELELPHNTPTATDANSAPETYHVVVNGNSYAVEVASGGEVRYIAPAGGAAAAPAPAAVPATAPAGAAPAPAASGGEPLPSPLAGNVFKVLVKEGQQVAADEVLLIMEAMKMETEVRSIRAGTVTRVAVREGDAVKVGDALCFMA